MRVHFQRVARAAVRVDDRVVGQIEHGALALVGATDGDDHAAAETLADKTMGLRVFADNAGKMNRSVVDVGGGILAVSQFTLYADTRRGHRPAFTDAAAPDHARSIYRHYCESLETAGVTTARGVFGADMQIEMVADGPVTILLEVVPSGSAS